MSGKSHVADLSAIERAGGIGVGLAVILVVEYFTAHLTYNPAIVGVNYIDAIVGSHVYTAMSGAAEGATVVASCLVAEDDFVD